MNPSGIAAGCRCGCTNVATNTMRRSKPGIYAIYGNTLSTLVDAKNGTRAAKFEAALKPLDDASNGKGWLGWLKGHVASSYSKVAPVTYDPYPAYNSDEWRRNEGAHGADYVPCLGPDGRPAADIRVFKGKPSGFPKELFGSFDVLGMDDDLCFERETRLGNYGLGDDKKRRGKGIDWDTVDWGRLQQECLKKNRGRFDMDGVPNQFLKKPYDLKAEIGEIPGIVEETVNRTRGERRLRRRRSDAKAGSAAKAAKEPRTALLLRLYTGKVYQENDKQVIRALVTELSLRTGGQYSIYLLVHVRDSNLDIWNNETDYHTAISAVPPEFRSMTILWNDAAVQEIYPRLQGRANSVHNAQWLPVQKFAEDHPEYDFVWNWEVDTRLTGHHYDFLEKLAAFARKQPRRGLWERSARYYIPSLHGDYDTTFRHDVAKRYWNDTTKREDTVWGPVPLPGVVKPVGPKPPFPKPTDDHDYSWGVGEDADVLTLGPIVDPVGSGWVNTRDVWGYAGAEKTPRRVTIITHSRVSRRLLHIMHVENLRGNHVASEMTPQTVALLHGLKAVAAPMPIFFDRAWSGEALERWFNRGEHGDAGGKGSPIAWGLEGRYRGSTWYYRAAPPQRLYLNWMGWEDTGIGGPKWEKTHGRPCLPPVLLHPIKDIAPTEEGYASESKLPYS